MDSLFCGKATPVAECHWHSAKSRLSNPPSDEKKQPHLRLPFLVEEDGFEPSKSKTTDLQSAPFGHLGTPPYEIVETWSWWTDSNPRPADYKSAALPAELHQRVWHITFAAKVIIAGVPPIVNMFSQKNQSFFSAAPEPPVPGLSSPYFSQAPMSSLA